MDDPYNEKQRAAIERLAKNRDNHIPADDLNLAFGAKYRADMNAAIKTWPWWDRPLVRFAVWITERREGAPDRQRRRRQ